MNVTAVKPRKKLIVSGLSYEYELFQASAILFCDE
jgi:hypothetical protein